MHQVLDLQHHQNYEGGTNQKLGKFQTAKIHHTAADSDVKRKVATESPDHPLTSPSCPDEQISAKVQLRISLHNSTTATTHTQTFVPKES